MIKPNALVIPSGNLIMEKKVHDWLEEKQKKYHLTIIAGAGEQTNQAFLAAGYEIKFCPLGRITDNLEQRQLCEFVARNNQAIIQDYLSERRISAQVKIPFDISDDVIIPQNGDVAMFAKYLGYDKTFRLTTNDRFLAKQNLVKAAAEAFSPIAGENGVDMKLSKIEIVPF